MRVRLLFVLLVLVSVWGLQRNLHAHVVPVVHAAAATPTLESYFQTAETRFFSETGELDNILITPSEQRVVDSTHIDMQSPRLKITRQNPVWYGVAQQGWMDTQDDLVHLETQVVLWRADKHAQLHTDSLNYDGRRRLTYTQAPVSIVIDNIHMQSLGIEMSTVDKTILFPQQVISTYVPNKSHATATDATPHD